ncbi:hypothetical protein BESB_073230 [Besnoitia besnoiti]|uniref:Uncharacterized protein n=1 Tax=Besnoitia besnoiti TaxID=94643 RepID=A0A2A9MCZ0_BESBE|nr:uncharacterized protein BESB_073230 [Besnoitia besnoiti]PFH34171.1 hypothetical protein BESB_073230 [Besnoitia besnoiti]
MRLSCLLCLRSRRLRRRLTLPDSSDEDVDAPSSSTARAAGEASSEEESERADAEGGALGSSASSAGDVPKATRRRWLKRGSGASEEDLESRKGASEDEEAPHSRVAAGAKEGAADAEREDDSDVRRTETQSRKKKKRALAKEEKNKDNEKKSRLDSLRRKLHEKDKKKEKKERQQRDSSEEDFSGGGGSDSDESAGTDSSDERAGASEGAPSSTSSLASSEDESDSGSLSDASVPRGLQRRGVQTRRSRRSRKTFWQETDEEDGSGSDAGETFPDDDVETAACTLEDALAWCLDTIEKEEEAGKLHGKKRATVESARFLRRAEQLRWDDELTLGGARSMLEAFDYQTPRPVTTPQLSVLTKEQKEIVFLDFPNEVYKTEYLHLRVFDWRTRRVVVANLLKCAAQQQTAWRDFDRWTQESKRFCVTREEKLNKMFQCKVAEPRGLRKLQHLLLRAEQCGLVERSKSLQVKRCFEIPAALLAPVDCKRTTPPSRVKGEVKDEPKPGGASLSQPADPVDAASSPAAASLTASLSLTSLSPDFSSSLSSVPPPSLPSSVLDSCGDSLAATPPLGGDRLFAADAEEGLFDTDDVFAENGEASFFGDTFDLSASRWNASFDGSKGPSGWGALKRTVKGEGQTGSAPKSGDQVAREVEDLKLREKELKRQRRERRDAEKKDARREAVKHQWRELQRTARCTHEGPRFHHPRQEEHVKGQEEYTTKFRVFSREELVYIRPPEEVQNKPREALDLYLAQLRRMQRLLEAPHKLKLAAKFGLISTQPNGSEDGLGAPAVKRLRANAPWLCSFEKEKAEQERAWKDLAMSFGQEPWKVPLHFIPASIQTQWTEKRKREEAEQKRAEKLEGERRRRELAADAVCPSRTSSPLKSKHPAASFSASAPSSEASCPSSSSSSASVSSPLRAAKRGRGGESATELTATPQSRKEKRVKHLEDDAGAQMSSAGPRPARETGGATANEASTHCAKGDEPQGHEASARKDSTGEQEGETRTDALADAAAGQPEAQLESLELEGSSADAASRQVGGEDSPQMARKPTGAGGGTKERQTTLQRRRRKRSQRQHTRELERSPKLKRSRPIRRRRRSDRAHLLHLRLRARLVVLDDDADELAKQLKGKKRRRLVTDEGEEGRDEPDVETNDPRGPSGKEETELQAMHMQKKCRVNPDEEAELVAEAEEAGHDAAAREETRNRKKTAAAALGDRLKEEARKARRKERKRQMRELIRQMTEFEAEENEEELEGDEEYKSALAELRSRLIDQEEEEDESDLGDSDEEFLEGLFAAAEDEAFDAEAEDTEAMQRKLQHDLEEREDQIYERLIGRFQKGGENAMELTEAERRELQEEERRRRERMQRRKRGDEHLEGIELDDWLSDDSEASSSSGEESGEEEESMTSLSSDLTKWASLDQLPAASLSGAAVSAAPSADGNPSLLVAQCRQNAERRRRILASRQRRRMCERDREESSEARSNACPSVRASGRTAAREPRRRNDAEREQTTEQRRSHRGGSEKTGAHSGGERQTHDGKDTEKTMRAHGASALDTNEEKRNAEGASSTMSKSLSATSAKAKLSLEKRKSLSSNSFPSSSFGIFGTSSLSCSVRFADDDSSFGMRGEFDNSLASGSFPAATFPPQTGSSGGATGARKKSQGSAGERLDGSEGRPAKTGIAKGKSTGEGTSMPASPICVVKRFTDLRGPYSKIEDGDKTSGAGS